MRVIGLGLAGLVAVVCGAQTGVKPEVCAGCHAEIAASYAQTGMARSFRTATAGMNLPEWQNRVFRHEASSQDFRAYAKDGRLLLRRHQNGLAGEENVVEKEAQYIFGSGNHARSYLYRAGLRLFEMPLTWYTEKGGYWGMSPAFDRPDHPGFTREITGECLFCHNAYPAAVRAEMPQGIDCQRCHGLGTAHVEAALKKAPAEQIRKVIVNPARLERTRQLEVCMQCHLETTSLRLPAAMVRPGRTFYSAGEPLGSFMVHFAPEQQSEEMNFVSAAWRLRQSRCFQSGKMTCTTCHDPHRVQRGPAAEAHFTKVCRSCHELVSATAAHARQGACATCHMPARRPSDVVHVTATDHFIARNPRPEAGPRVEQHDGNTAPYRGLVRVYYPENLPDSAENELLVAMAQVKDGSNLAGIGRLQSAIQRYQPANSEPYFELAEALRKAGSLDHAVTAYGEAARRKPALWIHFYGYGLALNEQRQPARALEELTRAGRLAPREPKIFYARGVAHLALGERAEAMQAYRKALELNPDFGEVWNNLGTALLAEGATKEAEEALRNAIRIRPDLSAARLNLAGLLLKSSRLEECVHQLRHAIQTESALVEAVGQQEVRGMRESQLGRAHLTIGIALAQQGKREEAVGHWKAAAGSREAEVRGLAEQFLRGQ